jgi:peptide/nickel transport system permease protein
MAFFRRLTRRQASLVALVILVAVTVAALLGPSLTPGDPHGQHLGSRLKEPGWADDDGVHHWLGTDQLGRDVLARLVAGSRLSLLVGLAAVAGGGLLGLGLGLVSGYFGGRMDAVIMRLADIQLAFPFLLVALALVSILGPSLWNIILVLSLTSWINYAKVVRGEVLGVRKREYVEAVRTIGASPWRIIARHILPNVLSPFLVIASFQVAALIIAESSLSYLGLGVPTGTPTWGGMLADGREYVADAWWVAIFPGLAIMLTALSFNLLGDGIRDALDPQLNRTARRRGAIAGRWQRWPSLWSHRATPQLREPK